MAVEEGEAVTAEVVAAIVTVTARGARIVRTEVHMLETVVQITAVTGTVAEAVTVMQVATGMPALEEARHGTRAAPETDQGLMTDPVVDPVVMMIVIEKIARMHDETHVPLCGRLLTRPAEMKKKKRPFGFFDWMQLYIEVEGGLLVSSARYEGEYAVDC